MAETDRELVEKAARAAGYDYRPQNGAIVVDGIPGAWNPLTDDGDALRLAVKLRIDIHFEWNGPTMGNIVEALSPDRGDKSRWCMDESTDADPYAATRRAIVRAAAATTVDKGEG